MTLPGGSLKLPDLHDGGQYQAFYSKSRYKILVCGRRWGKSLLAAVALIQCAVKGGIGWWVYPSFPMAMVGWRRLLKLLAVGIALKKITVDKQERIIGFPGGGFIQMKSAERANSLRGEGLDLVVIDEWAFVRYGKRVWESDLQPALAENKGKAYLITTPNGMDHVYEYYHRAKKDDNYEAFTFPTRMNPFIPRESIEIAKNSLPKLVYSQEYEAKFLEDAAAFFVNMKRVMKAKIQHEAMPGHSYRAGLDIGRWRDNSVMSVIDISLDPMEICWVETMTEMPFRLQKKKVLTLGDRYDIDRLSIDITGGGIGLGEQIEWDADFECDHVVYSNKLKLDMFSSLQAKYEMEKLLIPDLEWLEVEHKMMIPEVSPGSLTVRLNARGGFKDDGPNSIALANRASEGARVITEIAIEEDELEEEEEYYD